MSGQDSSGSPGAASPITPRREKKKRVGFHAYSTSLGEGSSQNVRLDVHSPEQENVSPSAPSSPNLRASRLPHGAPDADELRRELTKVISNGEVEFDRQMEEREQTHPRIIISEPISPMRPRPALRRNTSYDVPQEREEADRMEERASPRQLQSISNARRRADQLAVSLSSHSAPGSRRNSEEMEASFQSVLRGSSDHDDETPDRPPPVLNRGRAQDGTSSPNPQPKPTNTLRKRLFSRNQPDTDTDRYARAAKDLVKAHVSSKGSGELYHQNFNDSLHGSIPSGASTPVMRYEDQYDDYVPRPERYRGNVLASLLKLYHDKGGMESGRSTPTSSPGSPVMSPVNSPPTSRSSSPMGKARHRRSSSFFSYKSGSTSTLSVNELMKSSAMFAAPGSGKQISESVRDKFPQGRKSRSKKDHAKITVHIAGIIFRHRYLMKLCRALMMYGAPTHRLEEYMSMTARVLEIEGQFLYIPSCMIISFDDMSTHTTEIKIVRVPHGIDFGRLCDVHDIYKDVVHDKLGVEEASRRLDEVMARKPKYPVWLRVFFYGIASVCVAPFAFEGRFIDLGPAFILGCILGVLQLVFAPSNELYAHVFEVTAAIATSFLSRFFGSLMGGDLFCFSALAQSSIALILPGYLVLTGSLELQSHNIVAGSVRMVYAMIYTLFLGYGITIGASLYGMMDSNASSDTHCKEPLHRNWYFLFVPGFTVCLALVNQAKIKQLPAMVIIALAAWCVNTYSKAYYDGQGQISNMLGALTVGILANLYSRLGRHFSNAWLDILEFWEFRVRPRISRVTGSQSEKWPVQDDPESRPGSPVPGDKSKRPGRKTGYSLAAAAMLPAIFVQVPSGLAAGGSLLAGVQSANQLTGNSTVDAGSSSDPTANFDGTTFTVLASVIQVAIGISVGLFMSALIVYPLGKRRSGLFSF
ncbi:threonine/serine exporter domain-containing protein [Sarocladium implicatum]|nr:threonine/serine exporter domain-containing protein [Sarocladium implicatum]